MVCGPLRAGNYAHTNTGETFLHRRLCSGLLFQAGNNSFRLELDSLRHRQLVALLRPTKQFAEKDTPWQWTEECQQSFEQIKEALTSTKVLAHYDSKLPVGLACDASAVGVGAVMWSYNPYS